MEKISTILILYFLASTNIIPIPRARGIPQGPKAVEKWFESLPNAKEKLAKLHFYYLDTVGGKNPSAIAVAQANITSTSNTSFGLTRMLDSPLLVGPEPDSKLIGQAQGIHGYSSFEETSLLMTLNLVFTDGEYNGSTLSVLGRNPILNKYRELAIVGGSGVFRLARGIATAQTVWFNLTTQSALIEYDVVVLYYDSK